MGSGTTVGDVNRLVKQFGEMQKMMKRMGAIVDDPEAVQIRHGRGRRGVRLDVLVGPGDLGRVIGRKGRTAQSIRTVVRAAATKDGTEVDIEFVDA
jgi:predicted RNA-binding protein YlqC (UPF0109 family)